MGAFEASVNVQKQLCITDPELLRSIKSQIKETLLGQFTPFFNMNQMLFGPKATCPLDPESIEQAVEHLFEGQ